LLRDLDGLGKTWLLAGRKSGGAQKKGKLMQERERERSIERRCQVLILELRGGLGGLECGGVVVGQKDGQTTAHQH